MEIKQFEKLLKENNFIRMNDDFILFNDLEFYNLKTDKNIVFNNYDELYNYNIDDISIKDFILSKNNFERVFDGGRGSSSSNAKMGGGFTSADQRGRKAEDYGSMQFPARLNVGTGQRYKSYDKTLNKFEKEYKDAKIEYGAAIDSQGYATRLVKGGSTSVPISGRKGEMLVHNHPSGGNFSKQDLISIAAGPEKGIVAVGSNVSKTRMRYTITKTQKFDAKGFTKAVNKAQWPANLTYDKGADWWLRRNAKTYGYKYSAVKIK